MAVKVIVKGKKTENRTAKKIPAIRAPAPPGHRDNVIIRTFKIMLMDIRMRLNPRLRTDYGDYCRFSSLARGER